VSAAIVATVLAGKRDEFATALSGAALWVLALTVVLQIVALMARSEAWHLSVQAAGGTIARRVLYRASSMQVLGSVVSGQVGVAARIAALRRSSPTVSPQVPTLIAAEFPILAIEGGLAALTSFTLIGPLGLPWWLPVLIVVAAAAISAGLRHLAVTKGRELWNGLAVLRSFKDGGRVFAFVFVAVLAQMVRNWMLLRAVGVHATLWDAIAVLIAVVSLSQLPTGPSVGAASAVLILGNDGVAKAAAAGVLLTATGTFGGFCFAAWAGLDQLLGGRRRGRPAPAPEPAAAAEVARYARRRSHTAARRRPARRTPAGSPARGPVRPGHLRPGRPPLGRARSGRPLRARGRGSASRRAPRARRRRCALLRARPATGDGRRREWRRPRPRPASPARGGRLGGVTGVAAARPGGARGHAWSGRRLRHHARGAKSSCVRVDRE
jgi:hypothetical protein